MTANTHSPTLAEIVAVHEAAVALGRPSRVYRAGGVLGVDRWIDHAVALETNHQYALAEQCYQMAVLADAYGSAGRIAKTFEKGRRR